MTKAKSGFTIVELLIVIVVIGILAAITIVAYNNVQQRARNTVTVGAAKEWVKALTASYVLNGTIDISIPSGDNSVCLGKRSQYPATSGDLGEGQCYVFANTSNELEAAMGELANINMTTYVVPDPSHDFRGLQYYVDNSVNEAYINYMLFGDDQNCGIQSSQRMDYSPSGFTDCQVDMYGITGGYPILY